MLKASPLLKARPIAFTFSKPPKKHWSNDDPILTHFVDALIYLLPAAEDFFIAAMRRVKNQIDDQHLQKQIGAFCGQEAHHSSNHKIFNEHLDALGYTKLSSIEKALIKRLDWLLQKGEHSDFFAKLNIALTAGGEHYTSMIAQIVLENPEHLLSKDCEISAMLYWHAVEECEHKALCFDVFQAVSGNYVLRISAYALVTVLFLQAWVRGVSHMYGKDGIGYISGGSRLFKALVKRGPRGGKSLLAAFIPTLFNYFRPSFHPSEMNNDYLMKNWIKDYESGMDMTKINALDYA